MTVVDIHCHTFNADDLPVKGFVKRVVGSRLSLAAAVSWAVDAVVQQLANGADELEDLQRRLAGGPSRNERAEMTTMDIVDLEADELLARLEAEDPTLAAAAAAEARIDAAESDDVPEEGVIDSARALRRFLKFAALFGKTRWQLTTALVDLYPGIDLFTPLLVDFQRLEDAPKTTMLEQFRLQEMISRLSLLGHMDAVVLPFVGFDPRRVGALALVREAITEYGCVGVKMYPPMGFRPWGNRDVPPHGMTIDDAIGVDDALSSLYEWCSEHHVPITAHGNPSNYAHASYRDFSHPRHWGRVLRKWPDLHLNLGHFGWGGLADGWPQEIAALTAERRGLYADIGNHSLQHLDGTIGELDAIFGAHPEMGRRFMFGTDWFMLAAHPDFEEFHTQVTDRFGKAFPDLLERFVGEAALEFLGFSEPTNRNAARVRERIRALGVDQPEWLR